MTTRSIIKCLLVEVEEQPLDNEPGCNSTFPVPLMLSEEKLFLKESLLKLRRTLEFSPAFLSDESPLSKELSAAFFLGGENDLLLGLGKVSRRAGIKLYPGVVLVLGASERFGCKTNMGRRVPVK